MHNEHSFTGCTTDCIATDLTLTVRAERFTTAAPYYAFVIGLQHAHVAGTVEHSVTSPPCSNLHGSVAIDYDAPYDVVWNGSTYPGVGGWFTLTLVNGATTVEAEVGGLQDVANYRVASRVRC